MFGDTTAISQRIRHTGVIFIIWFNLPMSTLDSLSDPVSSTILSSRIPVQFMQSGFSDGNGNTCSIKKMLCPMPGGWCKESLWRYYQEYLNYPCAHSKRSMTLPLLMVVLGHNAKDWSSLWQLPVEGKEHLNCGDRCPWWHCAHILYGRGGWAQYSWLKYVCNKICSRYTFQAYAQPKLQFKLMQQRKMTLKLCPTSSYQWRQPQNHNRGGTKELQPSKLPKTNVVKCEQGPKLVLRFGSIANMNGPNYQEKSRMK